MKIKYFLIIIVLLAGAKQQSFSQAVKFQRTYGVQGLRETGRAYPTAGGGYIIRASVDIFSPTLPKALLLKTNSNGDTVWSRTYQFVNEPTGTGGPVLQLISGGYAFCVVDTMGNPTVVETNSTGDTIFTKPVAWWSGRLVELPSGAFLFLHGVAVKTDNAFNVQWAKQYWDMQGNYCAGIPTSDGGYAIYGTTVQYASGGDTTDMDLCLAKINSSGNVQWSHTYGTSNANGYGYEKLWSGAGALNGIKQTPDGGYIMAGQTSTGFSNYLDNVLVIKTDSTGTVQWSKIYGQTGGQDPTGVVKLVYKTGSDTKVIGYLITGLSSGFDIPQNGSRTFIMKIDTLGSLLWCKEFGDVINNGYGGDQADFVQETSDGGFIFSGYTESFGAGMGFGDIYLIKTDSAGNSGCNEKLEGALSMTPQLIVGTAGMDSDITLTVGPRDTTLIIGYWHPRDTILCPNTLLSVTCSASPDTVQAGNAVHLAAPTMGTGIIPYTYFWLPSSGLSNPHAANPVAHPTASTCYTVTVTDYIGSKDTCVICVVVTTNGIAEYELSDLISIFPNPSSGVFTIKNEKWEIKKVEVYNLMAEKIQELVASSRQYPINSQTIDLSKQPEGIYFVRVSTEKGIACKKIVIMK